LTDTENGSKNQLFTRAETKCGKPLFFFCFILFLRQQKEHLFRLFKYVSQRNAAANKRLVVLLD
jgi:hypothetical protein